jgi:hypothetical protein
MERLDGSLLVTEKENLAPSGPKVMRAPSRGTFAPVLEGRFFFPGRVMKHMAGQGRRYGMGKKRGQRQKCVEGLIVKENGRRQFRSTTQRLVNGRHNTYTSPPSVCCSRNEYLSPKTIDRK